MRSPIVRLALSHLSVNAVLLGLGYYWLGIGESRTTTLAWSSVIAILTFAIACCAYGAVFNYFRDGVSRRLSAAWRMSAHNVVALVLCLLATVIGYWLLGLWEGYSPNPAFRIASFLTASLRRPVAPRSVETIFGVIAWLLRWIVLPVLVLPVFAEIASMNWQGFRALWCKRNLLYWIQVPALLLAGIWIPWKLLQWVPDVHPFGMEMFSFIVRGSIAYLLFVVAWLVLAWLTSRGSPRESQSSTVVSP
jgi:hypothetical protein